MDDFALSVIILCGLVAATASFIGLLAGVTMLLSGSGWGLAGLISPALIIGFSVGRVSK